MRWIKAIEIVENTPEYKPVFARLLKDEIFSSGFFTRSGEMFICHCDNYPIDSTRFNELEIWDESPPASAVDEAARMYPEPVGRIRERPYTEHEIVDIQRDVHIRCEGMYTDTIDKLKAEVARLEALCGIKHETKKKTESSEKHKIPSKPNNQA